MSLHVFIKKLFALLIVQAEIQLKLAKNADFKKCMETELFIHKENLTLIRFNTTDEVPERPYFRR